MALTDNIVSYWKLDETSGTSANDEVGTNDGTTSNVSWATGKINNGGSFNGSSSRIECSYTRTNSFTVSAWIKTATTVASGKIYSVVMAENLSTNRAWQFRILDSHKIQLQSAVTPQRNVTSSTNVDDGNWHFVVATADGTNMRIYVDGNLENTTADSSNYPTAGGLAIGSVIGGTTNYWFNGLIDEVGIWSRALSPTEIGELYNSGSGIQYPFFTLTDNLISYWKFDESSGDAADSVGSNTGTNSNVTYSTGKINNGAVFNGSSSKLSITPYNSTTKTISLWAKNTSAPSSGNQQSMWCEALASSAGIQDINYINDGGTFKIQASIYHWTTVASYTHTMGTDWHHIAMTINGTAYTLYVDGVSVATGVSSVSSTYGTYGTIGAYRDSNNPSGIRWRNGSIDEVGIWNRALSPTEIEKLYNNGDGLQYPFSGVETFTPTVVMF